MIYDTIIVGSGLSGLNSALKLKNKNILLLEKNNRLGGRVATQYFKNYSFEAGGARYNENHKNLRKLIKKFKLTEIKIPSSWTNINTKNIEVEYEDVNKLVEELVRLGEKKPKSFLMELTLYELCEQLMGKKYSEYLGMNHPYYSEIYVQNSYDALKSVKLDLNESKQFYIVAEGLSELVKRIAQELKGKIKLNHQLINFVKDNNIFNLEIKNKSGKKILKTKRLILAIDSFSLKKIKYLNFMKNELNSVQCEPLFRIYQKYPKKNNKMWFQDLGKIVTDHKIRYIIPINSEQGIIMISYTDGKYTKYWKKKMEENKLEETIIKELDKLFPNTEIPKPTWTKPYYWNLGACYWKPNYDSEKLIPKIRNPMKNLYICGSNYSNRQAWMEGALENSF